MPNKEGKNIAHDNRNLDDHKGKEFKLKGRDGTWHGQELSVESDPIDPNDAEWGTKKVIIRWFKFSFNPELKIKPTEQELFNAHAPQIRLELWKDGLIANEDDGPKVIIAKNWKKDGYQIFITTVPKPLTYFDKPEKLTTLLK